MHRLEFTQFVPASLEEVWDFFSSPANLSKITPPEMGFTITSPTLKEMYAGMFIIYIVSPLMGIKMNWVTEITQVNDKIYFIDEQRRGPYSIWHHEHHFKKIEGGVEMRDIIHYQVPYGFLGSFADWLFVRKKIMEIFAFREKRILEFYPTTSK
jgi:ligand-binding SRPBCC domain-containing protein